MTGIRYIVLCTYITKCFYSQILSFICQKIYFLFQTVRRRVDSKLATITFTISKLFKNNFLKSSPLNLENSNFQNNFIKFQSLKYKKQKTQKNIDLVQFSCFEIVLKTRIITLAEIKKTQICSNLLNLNDNNSFYRVAKNKKKDSNLF